MTAATTRRMVAPAAWHAAKAPAQNMLCVSNAARLPPGGGRTWQVPGYLDRDGGAGRTVEPSFRKSPDSAATTCSRRQRSSRIRATRSSTFGTGRRSASVLSGRLFCAMPFSQHRSVSRDEKRIKRLPLRGVTQTSPRAAASHQGRVAGRARQPARFAFSHRRCIRSFLNGI